MILPITLTIAAAAAFTHFWLAARCGRVRHKAGISVGDGANPLLVARMRAHANFTENAPLFLILLALVEMAKGQGSWLWAAGIAFIVGRILHGFGMERPSPSRFRMIGFALSMFTLLALAVYAAKISYVPAPTPTMIG